MVVLLFSLAVSLDSLGVGVSYGLRRIRVPMPSVMLICLNSALLVALSMLAGRWLAGWLNPLAARRLGSLLLVGVGAWISLQAWAQQAAARGGETLLRFRVPGLGLVVQVLQEPARADLDRSGSINAGEAVLLGLALSLDALGAGFGAAVAGMDGRLAPWLVGVFNWALLSLGLFLGGRLGERGWGERGAWVPGLVLVLLGIFKI